MNLETETPALLTLEPASEGHPHRVRDGRAAAAGRPTEVRHSAPISPAREWYLPVKHATDFVLAVLLLVALGPVILVAAAVTRLSSPGPAFYRQTRLGRNGRPFRICKIRTMVHNAE